MEMIYECEVIYVEEDERLESKFSWCGKNPDHKNFLPVANLSMRDLPPELQTDDVMDFIKTRMDLTVKVKVPYTAMERPNFIPGKKTSLYPYMHHKGKTDFTRNGTGCLIRPVRVVSDRCPCHVCRESPHPEPTHYLFTVRTATHVIYNDDEAERATFHLFYDDGEDRGTDAVETLYGLHIDQSAGGKEAMYKTDICDVVCVTHDKEIVNKVSRLLSRSKQQPSLPDTHPPTQVIVSHPHGCSKRISIGTIQHLTVPLEPAYKTATPIPFPVDTSYHMNTKNDPSSTQTIGEVIGTPVPNGATFTLPLEADYAMKFYIGNPSHFKFPPGTKFASISGESLNLPDDASFLNGSFFPGRYYAESIVGPCAGTSGAAVYSNLVCDEVLTDLPHLSMLLSSATMADVKKP